MGKGYIQINSQYIRAIKGACGSTSNTPCTAAFFNGTSLRTGFVSISLQIISMTPQEINYKITNITGLTLPYSFDIDGEVQLDLLAEQSSQPLPNKTFPRFSLPPTLKSDIINQYITTTLFYNNTSDVTLSQLTPGEYVINSASIMAFGNFNALINCNNYQYIAN